MSIKKLLFLAFFSVFIPFIAEATIVLPPTTTVGGILVGTSSIRLNNLPIGASSTVLFSNGLSPIWSNIASSFTTTSINQVASTSFNFTTSSDTNLGLSISASTNSILFTPIWFGTLADGRIASASYWNSIQGIASSTYLTIAASTSLPYLGLGYPALATSSFLGVGYPALATSSFLGVSYPALATSSFLYIGFQALASSTYLTVSYPALATSSFLGVGYPALATSSFLGVSYPALVTSSFLGIGYQALASSTYLTISASTSFAFLAKDQTFTGANTFSGTTTLATTTITSSTIINLNVTNVTSSNYVLSGTASQCLQTDGNGKITGTGSACASASVPPGIVATSTANYFAYYLNGTTVTGTSYVQNSGNVIAFTTDTTFSSSTITYLNFQNATGTRLNVLQTSTFKQATFSGFVGVGTTTPTQKLELSDGLLQVDNIKNPVRLSDVTSSFEVNGVKDVAIQGKYAYLALGSGHFMTYDISDPLNPTAIDMVSSSLISSKDDGALVVSGKYAYLSASASSGNGSNLSVLNISSVSSSQVISFTTTTGQRPGRPVIQGKYLYIPQSSGLTAMDISNPLNPTTTSFVSSSEFSSSKDSGSQNLSQVLRNSAVAIQGKYAYYVSASTNTALAIFDISNPYNIVTTSYYASSTNPAFTDIYVSGKYAYVTAFGVAAGSAKGLYVFDISSSTNPRLVGGFHAGVEGEFSRIQVSGKYAYVSSEITAIIIFDISSSTNPTEKVFYDDFVTGDASDSLALSGHYLFLPISYNATTKDIFPIYDIGGADIPQASIGSIQSDSLNVTENASINNNLYAGSLNIGYGAYDQGEFAVMGTSTLATTTITTLNLTTLNLTSTTIPYLNSTNVTSTGLTVTNAVITTGTYAYANHTNVTTTGITFTNAVGTTSTIAYINATNVTSTGLIVINATITTGTYAYINSTNVTTTGLTFTNLNGSNATTTNFRVSAQESVVSGTISYLNVTNVTSSNYILAGTTSQCLQADSNGKITGTGSACASGGGVPPGIVATSTANFFSYYLNATTVTGTSFMQNSGDVIAFTTGTTFTSSTITGLNFTNGTTTNLSFLNTSYSVTLSNSLIGLQIMMDAPINSATPTARFVAPYEPATIPTSNVASSIATYTDDLSRAINCPSSVGSMLEIKTGTLNTGATTALNAVVGTNVQNIVISTIGVGGGAKGCLTFEGYHYLLMSSSTGGALNIQRATSSFANDVSQKTAWVTSTWIGQTPSTTMLGLIGAVSSNVYGQDALVFASSTTEFDIYTINTSTNALTFSKAIILSGTNASVVNSRANETGIYTARSSAPFIEKVDYTGKILLYTGDFALGTSGPNVFAMPYSFYLIDSGGAYVTKTYF